MMALHQYAELRLTAESLTVQIRSANALRIGCVLAKLLSSPIEGRCIRELASWTHR